MAYRLRSARFRKEREQSWKELEDLLAVVERGGIRGLSRQQLYRLPLLYRGAVGSLSVARTISLDTNLSEYLRSLATRGYVAVYGAKGRAGEVIAGYLQRLPGMLRASWRVLAAAALCLVLGIAAGFSMTMRDASAYYNLVPDSMAGGRTPASSAEELRAALYAESTAADTLQLFASFLFTNNAKIGIVAFALGIAAGAPTALLLFYNGVLLGALAAVYHQAGLSLDFWGWVLPHGITELGAVVVCGAAGFQIGAAVLFPGRETRPQRLRRRGRDAASLVVAAVLMFFIAALLEGFFRQQVLNIVIRYAVVVLSAVGWVWYVGFVGCARPRDLS